MGEQPPALLPSGTEPSALLEALSSQLIALAGGGDCHIYLRDDDLHAYVLHWPPQSNSSEYQLFAYSLPQQIEVGLPAGAGIQRFELPGPQHPRGICYLIDAPRRIENDAKLDQLLTSSAREFYYQRLLRTEEREQKYIRLLHSAVTSVNSSDSIASKLQSLCHLVQRKSGFNSEAAIAFLADPASKSGRMKCVAASPPQILPLRASYSFDSSAINVFASSFTTDIVLNLKEAGTPAGPQLPLLGEPADATLVPLLPSRRVRNYVAIQIKTTYRLHGYFLLVNKRPSGPGHRSWFTDNDARFLSSIGIALAPVVEAALRVESVLRGSDAALHLLLTLASRLINFVHPEEFSQALTHATMAIAHCLKTANMLRPSLQAQASIEALHELIADLEGVKTRLDHLLGTVRIWRDSAADSSLFEVIDPNKLMSEVRDYANQQIQFQHLSLELDLSCEDVTFRADRISLQVVLLGLLSILSRLSPNSSATRVILTVTAEITIRQLGLAIYCEPNTRTAHALLELLTGDIPATNQVDILATDRFLLKMIQGITQQLGIRLEGMPGDSGTGFLVTIPLT